MFLRGSGIDPGVTVKGVMTPRATGLSKVEVGRVGPGRVGIVFMRVPRVVVMCMMVGGVGGTDGMGVLDIQISMSGRKGGVVAVGRVGRALFGSRVGE